MEEQEKTIQEVKDMLFSDFATEEDLEIFDFTNPEKPYYFAEWSQQGMFATKEELENILIDKMEMLGMEPSCDFSIYDVKSKQEIIPKFDIKITNL